MRISHPSGLDITLDDAGSFAILVRPTLNSPLHEVIEYLDGLPEDCRLHFDRHTHTSRVFRGRAGVGNDPAEGFLVKRQAGATVIH